MKFENTEVFNIDNALRGMRNPKNSWDRNDTERVVEGKSIKYEIGPNDLKLAKSLVKSGSEHRKFMRQIFVSVDITAPLYWWSEFDTYKVGTVANSTSKMHRLHTEPITLNCFETDDMVHDAELVAFYNRTLIPTLEHLRTKFNETNDKTFWKELIRMLPESWLQKRTVTMNYENLLGMCSRGQRRFHKLNEWSGKDNPANPNFIAWARTLPYAQELLFGDEVSSSE